MKIITCALLTFLSLNARSETRQIQILGFDGSPVLNATAWHLGETLQQLKINEAGEVTAPVSKDFSDMYRHAIIIDAPSYAPGIWNTQPEQFALKKAYDLKGRVTDPAGKPVANAHIEIARFGTRTYTPLSVLRLANELPLFHTRTDSQGRYTLRGVHFNHYRFDSRVSLLIRGTTDNGHAMAQSNIPLAADKPPPDQTITILPVDRIKGVVVDAATNQPIHGAVLSCSGQAYEKQSSSLVLKTDEQGRFSLSEFRLKSAKVSAPGYHTARLHTISRRDTKTPWQPGTPATLRLTLRKEVAITGRVQDPADATPPNFPLALDFTISDSAHASWKLTIGSDCGVAESIAIESNGTFKALVPEGKLSFELRRTQYSPRWIYRKTFYLEIAADTPPLMIDAPKNPGMLFKITVPAPVSGKTRTDYRERVVLFVSEKGSGRSGQLSTGGVVNRPALDFFSTSKWGAIVELKVVLQGPESRILLEREIVADPASWPFEINAVELRDETRATQDGSR